MEQTKNRIIVLGDQGMLGHVVKRYFTEQGYDVIGLNRDNFGDFTDYTKLDNQLIELSTNKNGSGLTYVINCAGILNNSKDIHAYGEVNVALPRVLAHIAKRDKLFKLIHISTNCVFQELGPHYRNSVPNSTNWYGQSKAFGEVNDDWNLTIRCSIIGPELNPEGTGLMNWVLTNQNQEINGYTNVMWNGLTTLELAKEIELIVKNRYNIESEYSHRCGIQNYYSQTPITKFDLVRIILRYWGIKKIVVATVNKEAHQSLLADGIGLLKDIPRQILELKEWYYPNEMGALDESKN